MTEAEQWMAIYEWAGVLKATAAPPPSALFGVKGRFVAVLASKLALFWDQHKATLIPVLSQLAVAALEAVVSNLANIKSVDPPGPQ